MNGSALPCVLPDSDSEIFLTDTKHAPANLFLTVCRGAFFAVMFLFSGLRILRFLCGAQGFYKLVGARGRAHTAADTL